MNQITMPLCQVHQLPTTNIALITSPQDEFILLCQKCPQQHIENLDINQIMDHLIRLQLSQNQPIQNYLQFLLSRINVIKQDFLLTIENFCKEVKDQIKFFQQQIITPETINYYSTIQEYTIEDLKQLSVIFSYNFQMDNTFEYKKTNLILQQRIKLLHNRIKEANQLKIQIQNFFNPDFQIKSEIQTEDEDRFQEIPAGYKNYVEKDKIEYSSRIQGIEFSQDNQYIFVYSHELPLTAFKIINNKLIVYQKIEEKPSNINKISSSKIINRIYVTSNKIIQVYEENQQKHWFLTKTFDMTLCIHLIQVSFDEKIAIVQLKDISLFYPYQENDENNQVQLPKKYKNVIRDISFNFNGELLLSAGEDALIIWKILSNTKIEIHQCIENQSIIYAQFSDSSDNLICCVSSHGDRRFWKPDRKGLFYQAQAIYTRSCTYGCSIKILQKSKLIILGNHSIQILEEDQQNDNEWKIQQQIKKNCWNLDVTKDAKYIVADDFSKLCLYVREE